MKSSDNLLFLISKFWNIKKEFWKAKNGFYFEVPENIRYKWYIELLQEQHKIAIKRMWDKQSLTFWLERLYPLVCVICGTLDPENLIWYILTAFGGNGALKLNKTFSKNTYQKNNPEQKYQSLNISDINVITDDKISQEESED